MDFGLTDKVAIVTGAGSQKGFGHGICMMLAGEGCNIVAADLDLEGAKQTAASVEALGCKALAVGCDVTKKSDVQAMVSKALATFGKVDILVNNAGGTLGRKAFFEQDDDFWNWELDVNLKGTMLCSQAVLPSMQERKYGRIVNISSVSADFVSLFRGATMYAIAKMGVNKFTKDLAIVAIQDGIYVNCVSPGTSMDTNFMAKQLASGEIPDKKAAEAMFLSVIPDKRLTTPRDIAAAVTFFASDFSNHIMGQVLAVSGGQEFQ